MKVLHIISSLDIGGAQRLLSEFLPIMKDSGVDVSILVFKKTNSAYEKKIEKNGIRVLSLEIENIYSPTVVLKLIPYMKQVNIVHVHLFPALYWGAVAYLFIHSKLIYTEHNTNNKRRGKYYFKIVERLIYICYKRIISISEGTQTNLLSWLNVHDVDNRFVLIENGVNLQNYSTCSNFDTKDVFHRKGAAVLMISRFSIQKDQATLIRAIPYIQNKNLFFVFVGDGSTRKKIESLAQEMKVKNRCLFLGEREDIAQIISASYIGVQSSNWEGFGLTAVEIMAGGKPIIVSNVSGLREVVEGAGLIFPTGDEKALAAHINSLAQERDFYDKIACDCYERALIYDIRKMTNRYIEVYESIYTDKG